VVGGLSGGPLPRRRPRGVAELRSHDYVSASGDIDRATVGSFAEALSRAASRAHRSLFVDLDAVEFIDSSGYVAILNADRKMRGRGGEVIVLCEHPPVRRVLTLLDPRGRLRLCP
jgi:anti-sigma B factor antagonist